MKGHHVLIDGKCEVAGAIAYDYPKLEVNPEKVNKLRIYDCNLMM